MEPPPADRLPSVPGIDSRELLERIGEDLDLFWDVLGEFGAAYRDTPARIAATLGADPAAAKELTHTLKGVLGNLAATDLYATCTALDDAIREGRAQSYPQLLAGLTHGVPTLCDAIASARAAASGGERQPGPDLGSVWLAERYAALRVALRGHRARDCKTLADEIAAGSLPAAEQPFFERVHALVRSYRLQDAHDLLASRLDD